MAVSTKPNFFLRRPVLSSVISIVITLVGALAMSAAYPGASAETIASTVLAPLEVSINGVENMLYMTSTAGSGSGPTVLHTLPRSSCTASCAGRPACSIA